MRRPGIKILLICQCCNKEWHYFPSRRDRKYCSVLCRANSEEHKKILSDRSKGNKWGSLRVISENYRKKMSKIFKGRIRPELVNSKRGENNPNWKGGTSPINKRIRRVLQYFLNGERKFLRETIISVNYAIKGVENYIQTILNNLLIIQSYGLNCQMVEHYVRSVI